MRVSSNVGFWRATVMEVRIERPGRQRYGERPDYASVPVRPTVQMLVGDDSGARSRLSLPLGAGYAFFPRKFCLQKVDELPYADTSACHCELGTHHSYYWYPPPPTSPSHTNMLKRYIRFVPAISLRGEYCTLQAFHLLNSASVRPLVQCLRRIRDF